MLQPICCACGTRFPDAPSFPESCPICEDERQYVPETGQAWTTAQALRRDHRIVRTEFSPNLHSLTIEPTFAIGERGFLIKTPTGNVLWDCLALVDEATIDWIKDNGGLTAIAISHPHYYTAMGAWSSAFGDIPIYLHADDAAWVQNPHPAIRHWTGETQFLTPELTLIRCGGHFEGGTVLHWTGDQGILFTGDIIQVVLDRPGGARPSPRQFYAQFSQLYPPVCQGGNPHRRGRSTLCLQYNPRRFSRSHHCPGWQQGCRALDKSLPPRHRGH